MPAQGSHIKFLVVDVDGVLTDGGMYYLSGGEEFKRFSARDGYGLRMLEKQGIPVGLLSAGLSKSEVIVKKRAEVLGLSKWYVGDRNKLDVLNEWINDMDIAISEVAYVGDDMNDLEVITKVGLSACPADAVEQIKDAVTIVLSKNGGNGCVREFIDGHIV